MASDVSRSGSILRGMVLQGRIAAAAHSLVAGVGHIKSPNDYYHSIQRHLIKASDCGLIMQSPREVRAFLAQKETTRGGLVITVGSVRNFNRNRALPHFSRKDCGWFDFQLGLEGTSGGVEVLWYDFELRLPEHSPVPFVRLDLNPVGHTNEERALRSHLHVGSDDDGWSVPAPIFSPFEALDLMIHGLVPTGRVRTRATASTAHQGSP